MSAAPFRAGCRSPSPARRPPSSSSSASRRRQVRLVPARARAAEQREHASRPASSMSVGAGRRLRICSASSAASLSVCAPRRPSASAVSCAGWKPDAAQLEHAADPRGEIERVEALELAAREVVELAAVEALLAGGQHREREARRERRQRGDLVDALGRRADEQRDVVDDRLGRVAVGAQVGDRLGARALRELVAVRVEQQRAVRVARLTPAERAQDRELAPRCSRCDPRRGSRA